MPVKVNIDSFPFDEFGFIQGIVESISPNPLPPDHIFNYYRFPARIKLNTEALRIKRNGVADQQIPLQIGMSVNADIQPQECSR
jgi:hemolysin D